MTDDPPFNLRLADEIRLYAAEFTAERLGAIRVQPHSLEVAATWAILTRLGEPKRAGITRMQKLKLYDGRGIPGISHQDLSDLKAEFPQEGLTGVSPFWMGCLIEDFLKKIEGQSEAHLDPFKMIGAIQDRVSLIGDEELEKEYHELSIEVECEYEHALQSEVMNSFLHEGEIDDLFNRYLLNLGAWLKLRYRVFDGSGNFPVTDEAFLRSVEECIDIPASRADDFRDELVTRVALGAIDRRPFIKHSYIRLYRALERRALADADVVAQLEKIAIDPDGPDVSALIAGIKDRMTRHWGYTADEAQTAIARVAGGIAQKLKDRPHRDRLFI